MSLNKKFYLLLICLIISVFSINFSDAKSKKSISTEIQLQAQQAEIDDAIMAKIYEELTPAEKRRLKKIEKAQKQNRSRYEKSAYKKLSHNQPKTYEDYEKLAQDVPSQDLQDFNPTFTKDPRLVNIPEPFFEVTRYNYPAGSREINMSRLKVDRHVRSQGVLSPDKTMVAYTDINYDVAQRHSNSSVFIIPINIEELKTKKRVSYLQLKEDKLHAIIEELETNKNLSSEQKREMKNQAKEIKKEVEYLRKANKDQDKKEAQPDPNETPSQKIGKILLNAHIKDRIKEPLFSVGLYENDYGVQKNLTIIDWSLNSKRLLFKEKIGQDGNGLWQTNIWVYDFETGEAKKLDAIRQAIEYYWKKDRMIDLHYYRFDLYPLGWDANHSDRILLYAYGYTKEKQEPPKFLGTWSIDYKNEQSRLISVTKTGYTVQANGFCLKAKNIDYYEK